MIPIRMRNCSMNIVSVSCSIGAGWVEISCVSLVARILRKNFAGTKPENARLKNTSCAATAQFGMEIRRSP